MNKKNSLLLPPQFFENDFHKKLNYILQFKIDVLYLFDHLKNPINAIQEASKICEIDDVELVLIGSVYLVGDVLNYIISRDNLNFWEELRVHR